MFSSRALALVAVAFGSVVTAAIHPQFPVPSSEDEDYCARALPHRELQLLRHQAIFAPVHNFSCMSCRLALLTFSRPPPLGHPEARVVPLQLSHATVWPHATP